MNNRRQRRLNSNFVVCIAIQGIKFQKMPVTDFLNCSFESIVCTLRRWMVILLSYSFSGIILDIYFEYVYIIKNKIIMDLSNIYR